MSATASTTAMQPSLGNAERVLITGDLAKLSPQERESYYLNVCQSLGLNPMTQPFMYIVLNGKLQLYARKDATDQLRRLHGVSIVELTEAERDGVYVVTAKARDKEGRTDVSKGVVCLNGLKAEALANAIMKAETKAKRRVTLSICGLGMLDETEVETIPPAVVQQAPERPALLPKPSSYYDRLVAGAKKFGREWRLRALLTELRGDTHQALDQLTQEQFDWAARRIMAIDKYSKAAPTTPPEFVLWLTEMEEDLMHDGLCLAGDGTGYLREFIREVEGQEMLPLEEWRPDGLVIGWNEINKWATLLRKRQPVGAD